MVLEHRFPSVRDVRYCELDTYAMVKIWQRLREAAEGE
jgi:hypothetical protein